LQKEDSVKLQIQNKRIAERLKKSIIDKETNDKKIAMEVKMRESKLADVRVQNRMNLVMSKEHYIQQMSQWEKTGFQSENMPKIK